MNYEPSIEVEVQDQACTPRLIGLKELDLCCPSLVWEMLNFGLVSNISASSIRRQSQKQKSLD